jgi:acid phosphatase (class A)
MLHHIQETRTAGQIRRANEDEREESIFAFASVIGPQFNRASLPLTTLLSDDVRINERIIVNPAKRFFRRLRPYHLDPTIRPVCRTTKNQQDYSYPSGHGTTGYLEGLVLAEMVPERREGILSRAKDYAYSREVCGVHYPSDEVASRTVAYAMFRIMINNSLFRAELAAATVELRAKLGLGSIPRISVLNVPNLASGLYPLSPGTAGRSEVPSAPETKADTTVARYTEISAARADICRLVIPAPAPQHAMPSCL